MNEKWLEEIKRNDKMRMLDRYFPGKSCGNAECERLCTSACAIAKKMNVSPNELVDYAIQQEIVPRHACKKVLQLADYPNSKNYPNQGKPIPGCRFGYAYGNHPDKSDEQLAAQKQSKKVSTQPLPPKIDVKSEGSGHGKELFFREKNSPGKYGNFGGGLTFSGINDLIGQIEKSNIPPHGLDKLIIVNHSGIDDFYNMGNSENLRHISDNQIKRLKNYLHSKSIVDIRMCSAASGKDGEETAQKLADKLGCQVVVYAGPVSQHGSSPLFIKDPDSKIPWYKKILPDHKPKNFFPRVDKK